MKINCALSIQLSKHNCPNVQVSLLRPKLLTQAVDLNAAVFHDSSDHEFTPFDWLEEDLLTQKSCVKWAAHTRLRDVENSRPTWVFYLF